MKYPKELRKWINRLRRHFKSTLKIGKKNGVIWWDSPNFERKFANSKTNYKRHKKLRANASS